MREAGPTPDPEKSRTFRTGSWAKGPASARKRGRDCGRSVRPGRRLGGNDFAGSAGNLVGLAAVEVAGVLRAVHVLVLGHAVAVMGARMLAMLQGRLVRLDGLDRLD